MPGYAASVQGCLHEDFMMPREQEGVTDRLLLSVHAYSPYDFALQDPRDKGSRDVFRADSPLDVQEIALFMDQVYSKFVPLNIPVVIGEFGCRDKNGNLQSRVDFTAAYVALARARASPVLVGQPCFSRGRRGLRAAGPPDFPVCVSPDRPGHHSTAVRTPD